MIIRSVLFCFSVSAFMVTGNPLIQRIPVQSCPFPNNYQQNVYKNIFPDIPMLIQQPTNNVQRYAQQPITQNLIAQPVQANQPVNALNNQLNQIFVDRILSNPGLQTLLNPNSKIYNQKGIEVRRKVPARVNTGVVPNIVNNYIILPPEFLELNNLNVKHQNSAKTKSNPKKSNGCYEVNKNNAGSIRRKNKQNRSENPHHEVCINTNKSNHRQNQKYRRKHDNIVEEDRRKSRKLLECNEPDILRQSSRKQHTRTKIMPSYDDVSFEDEYDDLLTENQAVKRTNRKPTQIIPNNEIQNGFCECKLKQDDLNKEPHGESKLRAQDTSDKEEEKSTNKNKILIDNENTVLSRTFDMAIEPIELSEGGVPEKRLPRNPKDEAVIKDFRKKFPNIPEYTARSLLAYMKKQLQNQQFGSNFYYPNGNFPFSFEQFYRIPQYSNVNRNNIAGSKGRMRNNKRRKPQRSNRRNQNKKNDCKRKEQNNKTSSSNSETVIGLVPTIIDHNNKNITILSTTEKPQTSSAKLVKIAFENEKPTLDLPELISVSKLATEVPIKGTINDAPNHESEERNIEIKDLKNDPITIANIAPVCNSHNIIPELGAEDKIQTMSENGIIEDYYPDFTADNEAYFASDEDFNLRTLQDDRYHYMTNKKEEMEKLNRERRKYDNGFEEEYNVIRRPVFSVKDKDEYKFKSHINHVEDTDDQSFIEDTIQKPSRTNHKNYVNTYENQYTEKSLEKPTVDDFTEVEFRTPPGLLTPDFRTKRVSKNLISAESNFYDHKENKKDTSNKVNLEELEDKTNSYSNVKFEDHNVRVRPVNDIKRVKVYAKSKAKTNDIETVYAHSKVSKYGQVSDSGENAEDSKTQLPEDEANNDQIQYATDGNTVIVIAKSLNYPSDYW